MGKTEITFLIITICVSSFLLCIFLAKTLKQKPNKEKKESAQQKQDENVSKDEQPKEEQVKDLVTNEKQFEAKLEDTPEVSIALQNELDEFKDYLKSRVTKAPNDNDHFLHPYDTPKLNSSYDDLPSDFYNEDFSPHQFNRRDRKENLEDQSNKIKILMLTDFFNTKF